MFNRSAVVESERPVDAFLTEALRRVFDATDDAAVAVSVSIDTLEVFEETSIFSETARARLALRFHVEDEGRPVTVTTRADVTRGGLDVTAMLPKTLGAAIAACAEDFGSAALVPRRMSLARGDVAGIDTRLRSLARGEDVESVAEAPDPEPSMVEKVAATSSEPGAPPSSDELALSFYVGDVTEFGFQGVYQRIWRPRDSTLETGVGIGLRWFEIRDTDRLVDGRFVGLAAPFVVRKFGSEARTGPHVGLGGSILYGSESIQGTDDTNYFLGGMAEVLVGWIGESVGIQIGGYGIAVAGSDLVDTDVGGRAGLVFRLGS